MVPSVFMGNRSFPEGISAQARADILLDYMQYEEALQKRDGAEVIRNLRSAADAGYAQAQYDLAIYYRDGVFLERDFEKKPGIAEESSGADAQRSACVLRGMLLPWPRLRILITRSRPNSSSGLPSYMMNTA